MSLQIKKYQFPLCWLQLATIGLFRSMPALELVQDQWDLVWVPSSGEGIVSGSSHHAPGTNIPPSLSPPSSSSLNLLKCLSLPCGASLLVGSDTHHLTLHQYILLAPRLSSPSVEKCLIALLWHPPCHNRRWKSTPPCIIQDVKPMKDVLAIL